MNQLVQWKEVLGMLCWIVSAAALTVLLLRYAGKFGDRATARKEMPKLLALAAGFFLFGALWFLRR